MAVRPVVDITLGNAMTFLSIAVVIEDGTDRSINRDLKKEMNDRPLDPINTNLLPIDTQTSYLGVEIREIAALEEGIVAEPDPGYNMGRAKRDLFHFREELVNLAIENEFSNGLQRDKLLRPNLGCIKNVEVKIVLLFFWDSLNSQCILGVGSVLNSFVEVLSVEIWRHAISNGSRT
jgi:hypothetical protein